MLPESGFLFTQSKNELCRHTGSKQAKCLLKESKLLPGLLGGGRRGPLLSYRGFYPLKIGAGYQPGVQKDVVFSYWPCSITYICPCPVGVLGVEMSCCLIVSLPFSSRKLNHRRSGINIHLGHRYTPYSKHGLWGCYFQESLSHKCSSMAI